jgi:N-acetylmuramoyl-L-alanine amidase
MDDLGRAGGSRIVARIVVRAVRRASWGAALAAGMLPGAAGQAAGQSTVQGTGQANPQTAPGKSQSKTQAPNAKTTPGTAGQSPAQGTVQRQIVKPALSGPLVGATKPALTLKPAGGGLTTPVAHTPTVAPAVVAQPIPQTPRPSATPRFVVVLDAAHGGEDNGAQLQGGSAEKTLTLVLSVRLRSLLTARGFQVVTTRESNASLEPDARAQIANHANAAACLSLHATQTGAGVHIFVSSLPPGNATRFLAWKTAQAAYVTRSLKLASVVNSALEQASAPGGDPGSIPVTLARTALPGVDSMACPALAVEVSPLRGTNGKVSPTSASGDVTAQLNDTEYQSQVVEALAAALMEWRTDWQADVSSSSGGREP